MSQPHCFHPPSLSPTPQSSLAFCDKCIRELLEPLLTRQAELQAELKSLKQQSSPASLFPPSPTPQELVQKLNALRQQAFEKKQRNQKLSLEILQKQASAASPHNTPQNLPLHTETLNSLHSTLLPPLLSTYHTTCRTVYNLIDLKLYQLLTSFALTSSPSSLPTILNIPWVHDLSRYYPPLPSNPGLRPHVLRTAPTVLSLICSILTQLKAILLLSPGDGYIHTSNIDIVVLDGTNQVYGICDGYGNVYKLTLTVSNEGSSPPPPTSPFSRGTPPSPQQKSKDTSDIPDTTSDPFKVNTTRRRNSSIDALLGGASVLAGGASVIAGGTLNIGKSLLMKGFGSLSSSFSEEAAPQRQNPNPNPNPNPDPQHPPLPPPAEDKIPKSFSTGVTILASYIIRICVDQGVEVNRLQSMDFIGNLCRLRDVLEFRLNSAEISNKVEA
ncbi:hypothetical protein TrST_g1367 [Triparma strigata]|uniref:Uncharacterized protein n=1 Tax=Triparma strigata TaxID=1606541 RepID=A0A9W7BPI2_9STRA|nr:hypothetical protein TrST_g1367 [Triparma strigata]